MKNKKLIAIMRNPFKKKPVPKTFEQEVKESAERAVKKISDFTDTLKKMKDQERTSKTNRKGKK